MIPLRSHAFHVTGDLDSPHRVFEFCITVEVGMDFDVSFFPAAVCQCTVQNDGSGILTVVPIALFVSEAVVFTSSLGYSLLLKVSMKERLVYQPM